MRDSSSTSTVNRVGEASAFSITNSLICVAGDEATRFDAHVSRLCLGSDVERPIRRNDNFIDAQEDVVLDWKQLRKPAEVLCSGSVR
jgi:hypothetical protein